MNKYFEYKQNVIDNISDSFCAAKWFNATIWLGHGQTVSCHHPVSHNIDVDDIKTNPSALHNTTKKKAMRKDMLEGIRPAECTYCWAIEDQNNDTLSDRVYKTIIYDNSDIEHATSTPPSSDMYLRNLEISFGRTCNLACSYCNPAYSTTWANDIKRNGPYPELPTDDFHQYQTDAPWAASRYSDENDNPYIIAFWKWWENELKDTLTQLRVTGGEPFLQPSNWKLIDEFIKHDIKHIKLAINSNLSFPKKSLMDKIITTSFDVNDLDIYTSNESTKQFAEYIRHGIDYKQWYNNCARLLNESNVKQLHNMMTINALCLHDITSFLDDMMNLRNSDKGPILSVNLVHSPKFQSVDVLPQTIRQQKSQELQTWVDNNITKLHQHEIAQLERLIKYLSKQQVSEGYRDELLQDFKSFYTAFDLRRGTNFKTTFTEFADWYDLI